MNAQVTHTPGPWRICYDGQIDSANGNFICGFRWDSFKEFNEANNAANARLIAAAPELLEALKKLSFAAQTSGGVAGRDAILCKAIDGATAAIASATGAQP